MSGIELGLVNLCYFSTLLLLNSATSQLCYFSTQLVVMVHTQN